MKVLKVILYVFLGFIAFGLILGAYGTIGLKEAKNLEINPVDLTAVDNGTYTGIYENGRWSNTVEVTVQSHQITNIEQVSSGNSSQLAVFDEIIGIITSEQKIDIDTVSGATATTNSFLKAVENAFN